MHHVHIHKDGNELVLTDFHFIIWKLKRNAKMHPDITEFMCCVCSLMFGVGLLGVFPFLLNFSNSLSPLGNLIVTFIAVLCMILSPTLMVLPLIVMHNKLSIKMV